MRQVGEVSNALASPCLSQKSRAASSWSGVFSANVSTPLRLRLAMPVSVPAGGISRMPVTRRSLMVSMHRSQRTGLAIWPTMRATTSRPSWTTLPSLLEITGMRGSCVDTARASWASRATAGDMWSVWNAPATLSGVSRALVGGSSASAASCSVVPAATIWPGPLSLAAVSPCLSRVASTSSRSPPRTAVMPVAVTAAASAIALPRSRTSTMACSARDHPGTCSGAELADAVPGDRADARERVGRVREELEGRDQPGGDEQRLGDLGAADRVAVGLGAVVGQVEAGDGGQPLEPLGEGRVFQPRGQEAGRLGALPGRDDDEHGLHSAEQQAATSPPALT